MGDVGEAIGDIGMLLFALASLGIVIGVSIFVGTRLYEAAGTVGIVVTVWAIGLVLMVVGWELSNEYTPPWREGDGR